MSQNQVKNYNPCHEEFQKEISDLKGQNAKKLAILDAECYKQVQDAKRSLQQCEKHAATQLEKSAESNAKLISKVQDWQLA